MHCKSRMHPATSFLSQASRHAMLRCSHLHPPSHHARRYKARRAARMGPGIVASLTSKGRRHNAADLTVKRLMGEGSFGQVFEGTLKLGDVVERVVVKRVKVRVTGAEEMGQAEHLLNVYASKVAKGSCADFLGYCEVSPTEATARLNTGVWLIWRFEGAKTLAFYLRRRDTIKTLAKDMGVPEAAVVPTVIKQIITAIHSFHACGLVHRDIKPLNIIFSEQERRFKLIDLGACADLRNGTNYKPDESILDPNYCPPEQYVLPTDAPHLSETPFSMAISPMLWALHKPDRFDSWSVGLVLMQLCVPNLRQERCLKQFNTAIQRADYDLERWRLSANLRKSETELLDAFDGAGWELAQSLLRPRRIVYDEKTGDVAFVNDGSVQRIGMAEALKHPYLKYAQEPSKREAEEADGATGAQAGAGNSGVLSNAMGAWRKLTNKLFDLEAQIIVTASATQRASQTLKRLKASKASQREVKAAEAKLGLMQDEMGTLEKELVKTSAQAQGLLGFFGFNKAKEQELPDPAGLPPAAASTRAGSRGSKARTAPAPAPQEPSAKDVDLWQNMAGQLVKLERMLTSMTTATEQQTLTVRKLRQDVKMGAAEPSLLSRAENVLTRMQRRVDSLQDEYEQLSAEAADILRQANRGSKRGKAGSGGVKAKSGSGSVTKPGSWWTRAPPATPAAELEVMEDQLQESDDKGSLLTAGMRFTDMMVKVAGDIGGMIEKDAEDKKITREMEAAFTDLLTSRAVTAITTYQEADSVLGEEPSWQVIEPKRRVQLYQAYCINAKKREEQKKVQAEARLKALYLRVGVSADTTWAELRPLVAVDTAFYDVPDEAERLKIFQQVIAEAERQEQMMTMRELAEDNFRRLLAEVSNPPITPSSRWALVKQQLWNDRRYSPLSERRRQTLFEEYIEALEASGIVQAPPAVVEPSPAAATATPAPAAPATPATPAPAPQPAAGSAPERVAAAKPETAGLPNLPDLAELLQQQTLLREEYQKMEAKLKEMEAKLQEKEQPPAAPEPVAPSTPPPRHTEPFPDAASILPTASIEEEEDGSLVFQFASTNGTKPLQTAGTATNKQD